jgi:hypothetical protein
MTRVEVKQLEFLRDLVAGISRVAVMVNPVDPTTSKSSENGHVTDVA